MLNHIIVMGRLTRDPELRRTQAGTPVASFSIACDRDFKDKANGGRRCPWPAGRFRSEFRGALRRWQLAVLKWIDIFPSI